MFVTYSMGEPQVHEEEQEHIWSLIDVEYNFFRSQSAYFAENSISSINCATLLSIQKHFFSLNTYWKGCVRQLLSIRHSLTSEAMLTVTQACVNSWLDYCNSVLASVSSQLLQKMQVIQNAAARFVTGARRRDQWPRFYVNYTGCQCDKESASKLLSWCNFALYKCP